MRESPAYSRSLVYCWLLPNFMLGDAALFHSYFNKNNNHNNFAENYYSNNPHSLAVEPRLARIVDNRVFFLMPAFFFQQIIGDFSLSLAVAAQYCRYYGACYPLRCWLRHNMLFVCISMSRCVLLYGEAVCLKVWIALNLFIRVKI